MSSPQEISDRLGRKNMAQRLGVGLTAVSNAVVREEFPPSWLLIVRQMCRENGIECPDSVFGFKQHGSQNVDDMPECQEGRV